MTYIDTGVIYPQIRNNPSSVYSFLLVAGYLKVVRVDPAFSGEYMCEVAFPNQEITFVYNKEILQKLTDIIPQATFRVRGRPIRSSIVTQVGEYVGHSD